MPLQSCLHQPPLLASTYQTPINNKCMEPSPCRTSKNGRKDLSLLSYHYVTVRTSGCSQIQYRSNNYLQKRKKSKQRQSESCCQTNNVSRLMHSFCVSLGFHCRFPICPLNQVDVILTWPPAGALWASRVGFNSFWQANQRARWRGTINGRSLLITGQVDSSEAAVKTRLQATYDSLIANEACECDGFGARRTCRERKWKHRYQHLISTSVHHYILNNIWT